MDSILERQILENPVKEILWFAGILIIGFLLKRIIALTISKLAFLFVRKYSSNQFADEFRTLSRKPIEQILVLIILYLAFVHLKFPDSWALVGETTIGLRWFILVLYKIAVLAIGTKLVLRATDFMALVIYDKKEEEVSQELILFLKELIKVMLVFFAIFSGLRFIFNVNITALVASLGIGGLAVALAAQDPLTNLISSFIIYLDSPFKKGDIIEFGETSGTVEHVGFRSTRIRTPNKSLLIVPNKKIVDAILNNITSSSMRRVNFEIGLSYTSKGEQLKNIVQDIRNCIAENPHTADDSTVRFIELGESSLKILVSYFVNGNDYDTMIKVRETINLKIMEIVEKNGSEFASSSQFTLVDKEKKDQP